MPKTPCKQQKLVLRREKIEEGERQESRHGTVRPEKSPSCPTASGAVFVFPALFLGMTSHIKLLNFIFFLVCNQEIR